jgi:hypothetical protein
MEIDMGRFLFLLFCRMNEEEIDGFCVTLFPLQSTLSQLSLLRREENVCKVLPGFFIA